MNRYAFICTYLHMVDINCARISPRSCTRVRDDAVSLLRRINAMYRIYAGPVV
jgi:hypothetical protein